MSLEARVGEITAIAGPSGSGKSTIISLIVRFFDPSAGRILLDAEPIRKLRPSGVARDAFGGAAGKSAVHGDASATTSRTAARTHRPAEVAEAIHRAGLGDFVRSLPAGLDTMLGEKGSKFSTGQAQRLGLARAILRNAPILLLDEPTSALDVASEEAVMLGLRAWVNEQPTRRMVILATHRRTTASRADRIYQLAAGRLVAANGAALDDVPIREVSNA